MERGLWFDHFTGVYYNSPSDIHIDHLVPLKEAHISGACNWSREKKREYANSMRDHAVLLAVQGSANMSKGSRDPAQWMPPNEAFHCAYIKMWEGIKRDWSLSMDEAERTKIEEVKRNCQRQPASIF